MTSTIHNRMDWRCEFAVLEMGSELWFTVRDLSNEAGVNRREARQWCNSALQGQVLHRDPNGNTRFGMKRDTEESAAFWRAVQIASVMVDYARCIAWCDYADCMAVEHVNEVDRKLKDRKERDE